MIGVTSLRYTFGKWWTSHGAAGRFKGIELKAPSLFCSGGVHNRGAQCIAYSSVQHGGIRCEEDINNGPECILVSFRHLVFSN